PVAITAQPVSPATVCSNSGTANFTVSVSGTGPFVYLWMENSSSISNGRVYSGASTSSLTLTNPDFSLNGNTYTCQITNCSGNSTVTSDGTSTLTVTSSATPTVSITTAPSGAICEGTSVTFSATVSNEGTSPQYAWTVNSVSVGSNSTVAIDTLENNDNVMVSMTSSLNCATTNPTSNFVVMTVNSLPTAPVVTYASQMLNSSYASGNQWYFNDNIIPSATAQTYVPTSDGAYFSMYTDNNGCSSESDTLTVSGITGLINSTSSELIIYPNPSEGSVTVNVSGSATMNSINIYNVLGEEKYSSGSINSK